VDFLSLFILLFSLLALLIEQISFRKFPYFRILEFLSVLAALATATGKIPKSIGSFFSVIRFLRLLFLSASVRNQVGFERKKKF
jgi:hypothetical protein